MYQIPRNKINGQRGCGEDEEGSLAQTRKQRLAKYTHTNIYFKNSLALRSRIYPAHESPQSDASLERTTVTYAADDIKTRQ